MQETTAPATYGKGISDFTFYSASGLTVDLMGPQPYMIILEDIACGLGKVCRFGGQLRNFYSVAHHSVMLSAMVPDHLKRLALFHDAPEAYVGDMIKPLKNLIGEAYEKIENGFRDVIWPMYGCNPDLYAELKTYEAQLYILEKNRWRVGDVAGRDAWQALCTRVGLSSYAWGPEEGEANFLTRYKELYHAS